MVQADVVYIVDDDESVRKGLARLMRASGYEPRVFDSPERFLEQVKAEPRACLLLDITMPGTTGLQVQALLKQRHIDLPVIAVSGSDDERLRQEARALGARFFLRKPVDDQALLDTIAWVTGRHQPARRDGANDEGDGQFADA